LQQADVIGFVSRFFAVRKCGREVAAFGGLFGISTSLVAR
jgi:hypothetical protein